MKQQKQITVLSVLIIIAAGLAAGRGIFSGGGPGPFEFINIYGSPIKIYGKGIYKYMSADVAPQGIAQDVVTLFAAIPVLILSLTSALRGSVRGRFVLAGTLGYFMVTYLFYLLMAMINQLFLLYAAILCCSFFAFMLTMLSFDLKTIPSLFSLKLPAKFAGGLLMANAIFIAILWLSIVAPTLQGIVPAQVQHYTTLVVQGLDLGLLLPISFMAGWLLIRKQNFGYLIAPVYFILLSLLMTALTAKIIATAQAGASVFPAIIVIPLLGTVDIICTLLILKNITVANIK